MATRETMKKWIIEALEQHGGAASILQVCIYIWDHYEATLRDSGNLFYTWQYDLRWAKQGLREAGIIKPASESPWGHWVLSK